MSEHDHAKATDPVCGMSVTIATAKHTFAHGGQTFYFCGAGCKRKFEADPDHYLAAPSKPAPSVEPSGQKPWYCPMCAGVESDQPGDCPKCGMALESTPGAATTKVEWTCPMHPEVVRDGPGDCPKCGMALEPRTVTLAQHENPELVDMRRRLWVALAF